MPYCINNSKKTYKGDEPSPKGFGYCASGEKEETEMKGKDGNMWIKKNDRWVKKNTKSDYRKKLFDKLYKWWLHLAEGNIIIIYQDGKNKLVKSNMKTQKAQIKEIIEKWKEFEKNKEVKAIIWSAQSIDIIEMFIDFFIKKLTINELEELIKIKNLPEYLLENYKKYFEKNKLFSDKDYTFKN